MRRIAVLWVVFLTALVGSLWLGLDQPAELVIENEQEPRDLDPLRVSYHHDIRTLTALFEGLTRLHPKTLEPQPGAAQSWTVSPDGLVYRFELREGLRWANAVTGDCGPLTAHDYAWSWQRVLAPTTTSEYYSLFFCIRNAEDFYEGKCPWSAVGIRAENDRTLVVELANPTAYFLSLCAFPTFAPVHKPTVEAHGARWTLQAETFVCNGPYLLAERAFRQRLRLVANPHYWDAARVSIPSVDMLPIDNRNTSFLSYEAGYTDYVSKVPDEAARVLEAQIAEGRTQRPDLTFTPVFRSYFYRFNCKARITHPRTDREVANPLADARVRRALSLAVDRRALTEMIGLGRPPMAGLVPLGAVPHYEGVPYDHARDFNPALARQLLDQAGYRDRSKLIPLPINYNDDELHKQVAQFVAESWQRELGLDARPNGMEFAMFSRRQQSLQYVVTRAGWGGDYNDPMTFLEMFVTTNGHNQTGWGNPNYDRWINAAVKDANPARRFATLLEAERFLILEENPILPLYQYVDAELTRPRVRGYYPNARGHMDLSYMSLQP